jgi:hypothetical protein
VCALIVSVDEHCVAVVRVDNVWVVFNDFFVRVVSAAEALAVSKSKVLFILYRSLSSYSDSHLCSVYSAKLLCSSCHAHTPVCCSDIQTGSVEQAAHLFQR